MKVICVRDRDSFCGLGEEWNSLLRSSSVNSVFLSHEWFLSWWDHLGADGHLELYLVRDENERLQGIAPFMKKDDTLSFLASKEVTDYCDLICLRGVEEAVAYELLGRLAQETEQGLALELINIREESPTLAILPELAVKQGFSCRREEADIAPRLELPSSYADYLTMLSRKARHEVKRKIRRLEKSGSYEVEILKDPQDLKESIKTFIRIHKDSGLEKKRFWEKKGMEAFFQNMAMRLSEHSWVELLLLRMDGRTAAVLLNFVYNDQVLFYNIAYDLEFSSLSPGFFLFHHSIRKAFQDGRRAVDFLRGGEKYKYDFGAKNSKIYNLYMGSERA